MAVISGTGTVELPSGHVLDGLTIYGKCVQDGTPTPDAPVEIRRITSLALSTSDGQTVEIDLQGHELCSLPDGTRDVLTVDASGHVEIKKRTKKLVWDDVVNFSSNSSRTNASTKANTDVVVPAASEMPVLLATHLVPHIWSGTTVPGTSFLNPNNGAIGWNFSPGVASTLAELKALYPDVYSIHLLKESRTIDLGYVELPDVRGASTLAVIAEVEPQIDVELQPYSVAGGGCFDERA